MNINRCQLTITSSEGPVMGFTEFITLMALLISLTALSLDIILPALPNIHTDLQLRHPSDAQLVVSILALGLAIGQLFYGPVSDSIGRKPVIFAGIGIFSLGCLLSFFATQFWLLLLGRLLQGVGLASPRSIVIAIIRDLYQGRSMASIMSAVTAVFIVVPAVAPILGQGILLVTTWRTIFFLLMLLGVMTLTWFTLRQEETLSVEERRPFSLNNIGKASREICTHRIAFGHTLAAGLISGSFFGYLNSAQQLYQDIYHLGRIFPFFMGSLALSIGGASLFNSRFVIRWGMRAMSRWAIRSLVTISTFYLTLLWWWGGVSPLWMMMIIFGCIFFCLGILFGNLNAIAMEPLGHIAGIGSAIVGSLSTLIAVPLGIVIGRGFNNTLIPLVSGFAVLSIATALIMYWANDKPKSRN